MVRTPTGVHAYQLGDAADSQLADLRDRAAIVHNLPHGLQSGWEIQQTGGQPHPTLGATVHPVADLAAVTGTQLTTYRRDVAAASKAERMAGADRVLAAFDATEQDEFLDRYRPNLG